MKKKTKNLKFPKEHGESVRAVGPENEKYRLGYGVAGKGVQLPWYVQKQKHNDDEGGVNGEDSGGVRKGEKRKKTLEELREERLKREKKEKERKMALRHPKQRSRVEPYDSSRYYRLMTFPFLSWLYYCHHGEQKVIEIDNRHTQTCMGKFKMEPRNRNV